MSTPHMSQWCLHAYGPKGAGELRLESVPVPELRAPDDVLVRVHASSLNPLDLSMIGGYGRCAFNMRRRRDGISQEFPVVFGRDWVGEVVAAGPKARLRPGERAWGVVPPHRIGAHAHYVLVSDSWASPAPRDLDKFAAGSTLYAALTATATLRAAGLTPGRPAKNARVLLLGVGGVGLACLQLLVDCGVEVVVGCSSSMGALALSRGAHTALDRHSPDYDRLIEECGPYTAVLDTAGLGGAAARSRRWRFSRYVTLRSPLLLQTDARGLVLGALAAVLVLCGHTLALYFPPFPRRAGTPNRSSVSACTCLPTVKWAFFSPLPDDIALIRRLIDEGKYIVEIDQVFPWWEGDQAYERASEGHARGKFVLDWTAERPSGAAPARPAPRSPPTL